jgi:hypothetical protein
MPALNTSILFPFQTDILSMITQPQGQLTVGQFRGGHRVDLAGACRKYSREREARLEPNLTVATGRFRAVNLSVPADYSGKFIFFKNAL